MKVYIATIQVALAVDSKTEACDGLAEILRDNLRLYAPQSCLIDWSYVETAGRHGVEDEWKEGTTVDNHDPHEDHFPMVSDPRRENTI